MVCAMSIEQIRLEAKSDESLVTVISTTSQVGENTSSSECDVKGPSAEIALNSLESLLRLSGVQSGLEHDQGDRNLISGGFQSFLGSLAVYSR